uniref:Uncharacterized protein n=1 Tax=Anguilla anguilla TaxID=7936 RepID=A0A0E9XDS5_ANGAN
MEQKADPRSGAGGILYSHRSAKEWQLMHCRRGSEMHHLNVKAIYLFKHYSS